MNKIRLGGVQKIWILKEVNAGMKGEDLCRKQSVSDVIFTSEV